MTVYSTGVDCGGPPELRNGSISNTSMNTTLNSTVTYECDDGFEFIGAIDMSRTCLASHTLTHERGSGQAAIVELCNLDGFDDVTSSGATRCDQVIAIS